MRVYLICPMATARTSGAVATKFISRSPADLLQTQAFRLLSGQRSCCLKTAGTAPRFSRRVGSDASRAADAPESAHRDIFARFPCEAARVPGLAHNVVLA